MGMEGIGEDIQGRADLDDAPEIHDGDAVGDVFHDREIVRDEDEGRRVKREE